MNRTKNIFFKLKKLIPDYAIVPIASMLILNAVVFWGTRFITDKMTHYDLSGIMDYHIPFVSIFIIPYILAFAQWIVGYIVIARQSEEYCNRVMGGEIISKLIVGIIFIMFPTIMLREEVLGKDIFSRAVDLLYKLDAPTNLFPSIHCLESYICMKSALEIQGIDKKYRITMVVMSLLVFMSTVFIKQHVILDIFGAVIVAEAGRLIMDFLYAKSSASFEKRGKII
nr:hypothetical protein [uncultured Butyrivibrio sp.]